MAPRTRHCTPKMCTWIGLIVSSYYEFPACERLASTQTYALATIAKHYDLQGWLGMRFRSLSVGLGSLLAASAAFGGDVYKCNVRGASVYQDKPCTDGKRIDVAGSVPGNPVISKADPQSLSLAALHSEIIATAANQRRLGTEMSAEENAATVRLGRRDPRLQGEIERIQHKWLPQIQENDARIEALHNEVRRRCPRGASLSSSRQVCDK